jgi:hypothetical protein
LPIATISAPNAIGCQRGRHGSTSSTRSAAKYAYGELKSNRNTGESITGRHDRRQEEKLPAEGAARMATSYWDGSLRRSSC